MRKEHLGIGREKAQDMPHYALINSRAERSLMLTVKGVVQGVGFRPFCYRLASSLDLSGEVLNTGDGVLIYLKGEGSTIGEFLRRLVEEAPPLSHIDSVDIEEVHQRDVKGFKIVESLGETGAATLIPPDISICQNCLKELLDPADRRHLYPFINCTDCGPRYTIIESLPYDRPKTTMSPFRMCPECHSEYNDPGDRRFHAEPIACPECGPECYLSFGERVFKAQEALARAATLLREGKILAIKGLGGFHIACDALNLDAVLRVRKVKNRPEKPLALMMRDIGLVKKYLRCSPKEEALLLDHKRPILLLEKRPEYEGLFEAISPGIKHVGVMLPYTPLHYLLMGYFNAPPLLVMTSGNKRGEPIVIKNSEARERLTGLVDGFLMHTRPILRRVDDSVTTLVGGKEHIVRRARGYVPCPISVREEVTPVLAFGADLKNTICIGRDRELILSQHIGDLDSPYVQDHLMDVVHDLLGLLDVEPAMVVVDMHPDYYSSRLGEAFSKELGVKLFRVQHHHAHMLSVVAEHQIEGPVIGCILDGTGYGLDGTIWGGEVLYANVSRISSKIPSFVRLAHLEHLPLPGGDKAAKEPWRMAVSAVYAARGEDGVKRLDVNQHKAMAILEMVKKGLFSPKTSSAGRLFDAISSILSIRHYNDFEGQAAMELEALAQKDLRCAPYNVALRNQVAHPWVISVRFLIEEVLRDRERGVEPEVIATRFHLWLASAMAMCLLSFSRTYDVKNVVLAGGVFQNRFLLEAISNDLERHGLNVYTGVRVPVNDGGIALGQAYCGGIKGCV